MEKKICQLCLEEKVLKNSHIIPSFVGKHLKETSVTGKIRIPTKPNQTYQDIIKEYMFCGECETLMSDEETRFANNFFYPIHKEKIDKIEYDYHLGRFCTIQSYRTLKYFDYHYDDVNKLKPFQIKRMRTAENQFREIILKKSSKSPDFTHHIVTFDVVDFVGSEVPAAPFRFNKYLLRAIDCDLPHNDNIVYIYSKLMKIAILTYIVPKNPKASKGTRIYKTGTFNLAQQISFSGFLDFLYSRAGHIDNFDRNVSENQRKIIDERFEKNSTKIINSESQKALFADHKLRDAQEFHKIVKNRNGNSK